MPRDTTCLIATFYAKLVFEQLIDIFVGRKRESMEREKHRVINYVDGIMT